MTTAMQAPPKSEGAMKPRDQFHTLADLLNSKAVQMQLSRACKNLAPETVARVALTAARNNPKLVQANPHSFLAALMEATQLGLTVAAGSNQAHLVPYAGEVKLIIGYEGKTNLMYRSGMVRSINRQLVYANDSYSYQPADVRNPIQHKPTAMPERGEVVAGYVIAETANGGIVREWMWRHEFDATRARALGNKRNVKESPWTTDFGRMCLKTLTLRISHVLPCSPEMQIVRGMEDDARQQGWMDDDGEMMVDVEAEGRYADEALPASVAPSKPKAAKPATPKQTPADKLKVVRGKIADLYAELGPEVGDKVLSEASIEGMEEVNATGDVKLLEDARMKLQQAKMDALKAGQAKEQAAPGSLLPGTHSTGY